MSAKLRVGLALEGKQSLSLSKPKFESKVEFQDAPIFGMLKYAFRSACPSSGSIAKLT